MTRLIIEFEPNFQLLCNPPLWKVTYYVIDTNANSLISPITTIFMTYIQLKQFLEECSYETNNITELQKFGINTSSMKENHAL